MPVVSTQAADLVHLTERYIAEVTKVVSSALDETPAVHADPPWVSVAMIMAWGHEFVATGSTRQQAVDNVLDAWRLHAAQENLNPDDVGPEDVTVMQGPLGMLFRDGQPID